MLHVIIVIDIMYWRQKLKDSIKDNNWLPGKLCTLKHL